MKQKVDIREAARREAEAFIKEEREYQMGYISAEQRNPHTVNMSEAFAEDISQGLSMLVSCDAGLAAPFRKALESAEFHALREQIERTLAGGGKIYLSGCGSSGRLCMRLEASWREALGEIRPKLCSSVEAVMTGGDFALIRAVESFEDYIALGKHQIQRCGITSQDLLIGVTATGETTSVLGTAAGALEAGAEVVMVVCSDPGILLDRMERARIVYTHPSTRVLCLDSGPMALTGSTRMQASTIEQLVLAAAFNDVVLQIAGILDQPDYAAGFEQLMQSMQSDAYKQCMAEEVQAEETIRRRNGYLTYFAEEYLLDVLTDTTERGPTFHSPKFKPQWDKEQPLSWEFAKNPCLQTKEAWYACLGRAPRCIEWSREEYLACGIPAEKEFRIGWDALSEFEIGCESDPERESLDSTAIWVGFGEAPEAFAEQARRYPDRRQMIGKEAVQALQLMPTHLKIFEHVAMKLTLNTISTAVMARMGRIKGNYMVYLDISNKKLVDRAARIIAELCRIPYEEAVYELFLSRQLMGGRYEEGSPVQYTIDRLSEG